MTICRICGKQKPDYKVGDFFPETQCLGEHEMPTINYMQQVGVGVTFCFWCIGKHPMPMGATYLYKGNSLCPDCYRNATIGVRQAAKKNKKKVGNV